MMFCEFVGRNAQEVECPDCGRAFSGTPEDYRDRIVCAAKGPGADLEAIFKQWADRLKIAFKPCGKCRTLKLLMNARGKEWVRGNIDMLANGVHANAQEMGITVPLFLIKRWLMQVSS